MQAMATLLHTASAVLMLSMLDVTRPFIVRLQHRDLNMSSNMLRTSEPNKDWWLKQFKA